MTTDPDPSTVDLGVRLAQACAPGFVYAVRHLQPDEQVEFVRAFLACVSGIAQEAIGHDATVEALTFVATLRPVEGARPTH